MLNESDKKDVTSLHSPVSSILNTYGKPERTHGKKQDIISDFFRSIKINGSQDTDKVIDDILEKMTPRDFKVKWKAFKSKSDWRAGNINEGRTTNPVRAYQIYYFEGSYQFSSEKVKLNYDKMRTYVEQGLKEAHDYRESKKGYWAEVKFMDSTRVKASTRNGRKGKGGAPTGKKEEIIYHVTLSLDGKKFKWKDMKDNSSVFESIINESITSTTKDLEKVIKDMKTLVGKYKTVKGKKKEQIVVALKQLNNRKKDLNRILDQEVSGLDADAEMEVNEGTLKQSTDSHATKFKSEYDNIVSFLARNGAGTISDVRFDIGVLGNEMKMAKTIPMSSWERQDRMIQAKLRNRFNIPIKITGRSGSNIYFKFL